MSVLAQDMAGTGAMLVRLIGIGDRAGLTAPQVLLHVLDGVPLDPGAPAPAGPRRWNGETKRFESIPDPEGLAEATAFVVETAHASSPQEPELPSAEDDPLCFEFPEAPAGYDQERLDALNDAVIAREFGDEVPADAAPPEFDVVVAPEPVDISARLQAMDVASRSAPWAPAKGSKADQALDLWATTDLTGDEIAARTGSTGDAVRSVIRKGRERGEPRAKQRQKPAGIQPTAVSDDPMIAEALATTLKHDQVLNLYGATALRPGAIARHVGSTGGGVSYFLRQGRLARDPRIAKGDALRGGAPRARKPHLGASTAATDVAGERSETEIENWQAPAEAPMAVDGDGGAHATAAPSQSITIPPAGDGEDRRVRTEPDVSPERATENAEPDATPAGAVVAKTSGATGGESAAVEVEAVPPAPASTPELPSKVLSVEAGVIVGPGGRRKGFPLVNGLLIAMQSGEPFDAAVAAKKAGLRSADAALAVLAQWKTDLASIGIDVVLIGPRGVRLRRTGDA